MTKIKMNLGDVIPNIAQIKKELEEEEQQFYNYSAVTAATAVGGGGGGGVPRRRVLEAQRNLEELVMANSMRLEAMKGERPGKKFTCKTCNRDFGSFQALGGHRAGHKRLPRTVVAAVVAGENGVVLHSGFRVSDGFKSRRMHICSVCGVEFATGQALGGHMRRHRLDSQFAAAAASGGGGSDCTSEMTLDDGGAWENGYGIKGLDLELNPCDSGGISGNKGLDLELNLCESGGISGNKGLDLDLNLNLYDNYMKFFD